MRRAIMLVLAAASSIAMAQQEATTPTFRAGTKLVEVDVVAKSHGAPAKGLTKEDFTLTDNGKRQTIAVFSVRSATTERRNAAEMPLPLGTYSNRLGHDSESAGRTIVILLDQLNTSQELQAYAIPRIRKYIESQRRGDRLAVYTLTGGGLRVLQDLTGDPELLKRAADQLRGRNPDPRSKDTTGMTEHAAQAYDAMNIAIPAMAVRDALREIGRHLANVPGRKSLVWVTTSFQLFNPELGVDWRPEMEQAAHALNDAGVSLYSVDAHGLFGALGVIGIPRAEDKGPPLTPMGVARSMQRRDVDTRGLATEQMLSGLTGGLTFFDNSNAIEESVETAADDADVTYTLGFYPDESTQDSKWHDLKLSLARRGVELRYRKSYFARRESDATDAAPTLEQILREPLDSAQLALQAEAHLDPIRPQVINLKVNIDLHDIAFIHANSQRTGAVDLSFYVAGTTRVFKQPLRIEIPDDRFDAALAKGLDAIAPVDISGGRDFLRIVAQDKSTGAAGSVTVPLPAR